MSVAKITTNDTHHVTVDGLSLCALPYDWARLFCCQQNWRLGAQQQAVEIERALIARGLDRKVEVVKGNCPCRIGAVA